MEAKKIKLLQDQRSIPIKDFGAGSRALKKEKHRKIAAITRHSSSPTKFSLLYQFFCGKTPAQTVLELGTCVGINTCYLAKVTKGTLFTFEGAEALGDLAESIFEERFPIQLVRGNIDQTLPYFLKKKPKLDFVLMDAHHTYKATIAYFDQILPFLHEDSIVAIGDIHWSQGMEKAWEEIKTYPGLTVSMDFFECGILFFKKGVPKNNYILHF
ncbi:class I SAM-dependent methyltransferase [Echinicola jeungdonensis]|uniref:O-methyltransferase n=1 Tax=Echinicola jeungdonensis TaxID=709343 RepID=A0ABV5J936_9BACT|nr:class I SAM-dependent methyltransferase [Echinicola jeungdonensis]MDN3670149.1 class I SAM-dependent methyltransferase [Echinicola jeungdonensis]